MQKLIISSTHHYQSIHHEVSSLMTRYKCPKLQKAIIQEVFFKISAKVNQIVYLLLPDYLSSFKTLVPMAFEIFCWKGKTAKSYKGP